VYWKRGFHESSNSAKFFIDKLSASITLCGVDVMGMVASASLTLHCSCFFRIYKQTLLSNRGLIRGREPENDPNVSILKSHYGETWHLAPPPSAGHAKAQVEVYYDEPVEESEDATVTGEAEIMGDKVLFAMFVSVERCRVLSDRVKSRSFRARGLILRATDVKNGQYYRRGYFEASGKTWKGSGTKAQMYEWGSRDDKDPVNYVDVFSNADGTASWKIEIV
jgi:hypothetical protein